MLDSRHSQANRINAARESLGPRQRRGGKFLRHRAGALRIRIHHAHQIRIFELAVRPQVVPTELACADHGAANLLPAARARAQCFLSPAPAGSTASIAMPAALAVSIRLVRSNSRVLCASMASAVAADFIIIWTVERPTTGTSKRMSCLGLLTFTTTSGAPPAMRPARSMVSSVPSMASIATQARRSEEHTSELQSPCNLVCRLLLEKKKTA